MLIAKKVRLLPTPEQETKTPPIIYTMRVYVYTMNTQRYWGINVYGEALSDMGHHG